MFHNMPATFEPKMTEKAIEDLLGLPPSVLKSNSELIRSFNSTPDDEIDPRVAQEIISRLAYCYFSFPVEVKEGHTIIRGRPVGTGAVLPYVNDLGSPPDALATTGRANAAGESIFYGASSDETVFAELRLTKGQSTNISAWTVNPESQLLAHVIGELDYLRRWNRLRFLPVGSEIHIRNILERLHPDVALAVQLVDAFLADRFSRVGSSSYRVTNLIAQEFLRSRTIEGVIYGSVAHPGGFNYAIKRMSAEAKLRIGACQALEILEDYGYGSIKAKRYGIARVNSSDSKIAWITPDHELHVIQQAKAQIQQDEFTARWMRMTP